MAKGKDQQNRERRKVAKLDPKAKRRAKREAKNLKK